MKLTRELDFCAMVRGNHDDYVASGNTEMSGFNANAKKAINWTREQLDASERSYLATIPYQTTMPGVGVTLVHATLDNPDKWGYIFDRFMAETSMQYQWTPLCFFGHTHTPLAFDKSDLTIGGTYDEIKLMPNHKYLVNVGSVGQPRDRDPRAGFVTYDPEERIVQLHRVAYDIEACQKKIVAAGLPIRLSERLAVGR